MGGAEQHLIQLCIGLRSAGHVVEVAAPRASWVSKQLANKNFIIHDYDFKSHCDPLALFRLTNLLLKNKFEVVHTHLVRAAFYGRIATYLAKTPLVSTVHDLMTWKHYPRKRNIVAVSKAVKRNLVSRKFSDSKIDVVFPGAVDCDLGSAAENTRKLVRNELRLATEDVAIFLIGRVAEVKGHDVALEAMRIVRQKYGDDVKLFFVGQETSWGSKIRLNDSTNGAIWLGRREDIPQLLSAADICIQPSRSEGLPLSLLEAASASKALIGSSVGGIPEVIEDQVNGLLVPPNNERALAGAIMSLIDNPILARNFGIASRRKFEDQFSIDRMIQRTLNVYEKLI